MSFMKTILGSAAAAALSATAAMADPAIIFDLGGKFDKSFNEAAFQGAQRWADETGGSFREIELQNEAQREQALRRFAEAGSNPIVMAGFAFSDALSKVAPDYPDTKFAVIDVNWLSMPNVRGIGFNEHEGSYLVGMLAAQASATGTVGFVGGMDIPLIRAFQCGYEQGVMAVNSGATVLSNMTGTTPAAWNDPAKGSELTQSQIDRGADVVYQAAGGTGAGVISAAVDAGKLAIGVDSNQNHLAPGSILTSMLKRVDVAAYNTMKDGLSGDFNVGVQTLGLAEDGVGWSLDEHNASLISDDMKAALDAASAKIISGEIDVHDYRSDNTCSM